MQRYPILFPYLQVSDTTKPGALATKVGYTFDHSGIVELILTDKASRIKVLYMLAKMSGKTTASAQVAPRRRDSRARVLVTKGAFVSDVEDFEVCRVSAKTDPAKLAESMRIALFGWYNNDTRLNNVELRVIGPGSAAIAMFALEQLRFDSWRDIRFTARFSEVSNVSDQRATGLTVTVGVCNSDDSDESEPDEQEPDLLQVRWTPLLNADLFPTLFVGKETGSMRLGTKLTATLSVCTTRIVELLLVDRDARARLLYTLAVLPPWLEAVGQVAPRRRDSRGRFRVVRDYPLQGEVEEPQLRVSSGTEPQKLANALFARLLDKQAPEEAVEVQLMGADAAARAMLALEHLQSMSKREVSFWPRFEVVREDKEGVQRGLVVTVVVT